MNENTYHETVISKKIVCRTSTGFAMSATQVQEEDIKANLESVQQESWQILSPQQWTLFLNDGSDNPGGLKKSFWTNSMIERKETSLSDNNWL